MSQRAYSQFPIAHTLVFLCEAKKKTKKQKTKQTTFDIACIPNAQR